VAADLFNVVRDLVARMAASSGILWQSFENFSGKRLDVSYRRIGLWADRVSSNQLRRWNGWRGWAKVAAVENRRSSI
jgi:hypothetical protein